MNKLIILIALLTFQTILFAQVAANKDIYNPNADAAAEIAAAVKLAKQTNKHVLIQVGGNWCIWCHRLHNFLQADPSLDSLMNARYVVVHVNYDTEHQNQKVLQSLDNPQRFGFPVLVILNEKGKRIHTQDTALLEQETVYYNKDHLRSFFINWSKSGLTPPFHK